jgi:hypothetical protein
MINTKNKLLNCYNQAVATERELDKLLSEETITIPQNIQKKWKEITIAEDELFNTETKIYSYDFKELSDWQINCIKPKIFFYTTEGFEFNDYIYYRCEWYWKQIEDTYRMNIRVRCYCLDPDTYSAYDFPVYYTVKLTMLNNQSYNSFKKVKS